jgi:peptidoglycan-binding domain 1 protein
MKLLVTFLLLLFPCLTAWAQRHSAKTEADSTENATDILPDTIIRLTDEDYKEVAERLGVEVAAMKAVVDIEAGVSHQGFYAPGKPIINFDLTMFRRFAGKRGINLAKYRSTHAEVFSAVNPRRHGSTQAAQHVRLRKARSIDERTAIEGTFWGMFQIGGFNWKKCGAESISDFYEKMSRSERDQLELFANFLQNTGLDKYLRAKNWAAFSRGYNGPGYAKRRYHTRMASAYSKHKAREKSGN